MNKKVLIIFIIAIVVAALVFSLSNLFMGNKNGENNNNNNDNNDNNNNTTGQSDGIYVCKYNTSSECYYEYVFKIIDNKLDTSYCNIVDKYNNINEYNNDTRVIRFHNNEDVNSEGIFIFEDSLEVKQSDSSCFSYLHLDEYKDFDSYMSKLKNSSLECTKSETEFF